MTTPTAAPPAGEHWIDRDGIFRGNPIEASIITGAEGSQSVGLNVKCFVQEALDGSNWQPWDEYGFVAAGTLWIIKKDGSINENAAETARDVLGWDGDFDHVEGTQLRMCQFTVKGEEYKEKMRYRIEWFNPYEFSPGPRAVDAGQLSKLKTTHGAKMRAFFGQRKSAAPAPAGKPAPPPPAAKKSPPAPPSAPAGVDELPNATTRDEAWEHLSTVFGNRKDVDVTGQWTQAIAEVQKSSGRDEAAFTAADWASVAGIGEIPF
jgi:hypothetical protein